jgi:pyochelin biosynthetic protein PchC
MPDAEPGDRWLRTFHAAYAGAPHLVCFPHAGGSAPWFKELSAELAGRVRLSAVQYPGRLDRFRDAPVTDLLVLADRVAEVLLAEADRPAALFGHSMGALIAFEVARRLEAASLPVANLFVSARVAPHLRRDRNVHLLSDDDLVANIELLGGTRPGALRTAGLRALMLPQVRNDYRAIAAYRYEPAPPLAAPITALVGADDPIVSVMDIRAWHQHTTAAFTLDVLPGGHFYPVDQWTAVADRIGHDVFTGQDTTAHTALAGAVPPKDARPKCLVPPMGNRP